MCGFTLSCVIPDPTHSFLQLQHRPLSQCDKALPKDAQHFCVNRAESTGLTRNSSFFPKRHWFLHDRFTFQHHCKLFDFGTHNYTENCNWVLSKSAFLCRILKSETDTMSICFCLILSIPIFHLPPLCCVKIIT